MSGNNKNPHDDFYDDDDKFENFHEEGESDLPEYPTRKPSTSPAQSSHEGQEYQDLNDDQEVGNGLFRRRTARHRPRQL